MNLLVIPLTGARVAAPASSFKVWVGLDAPSELLDVKDAIDRIAAARLVDCSSAKKAREEGSRSHSLAVKRHT